MTKRSLKKCFVYINSSSLSSTGLVYTQEFSSFYSFIIRFPNVLSNMVLFGAASAVGQVKSVSFKMRVISALCVVILLGAVLFFVTLVT